jgi:putative transposase
MPRQARGDVPAGIYHVTLRSAGPIEMFRDDDDRAFFCTLLAQSIKTQGWTCHAFCMMTTHYHLLLSVEHNTLQLGMQRLNGPYAQRFNGKHRRSGHLRGDRYHAVAVTSEGHLIYLVRYLADNPVKAGLCKRPSDWFWGSYRGLVGLDGGFSFVDPSLLLALFGDDRDEAIRLLRVFVGDSE